MAFNGDYMSLRLLITFYFIVFSAMSYAASSYKKDYYQYLDGSRITRTSGLNVEDNDNRVSYTIADPIIVGDPGEPFYIGLQNGVIFQGQPLLLNVNLSCKNDKNEIRSINESVFISGDGYTQKMLPINERLTCDTGRIFYLNNASDMNYSSKRISIGTNSSKARMVFDSGAMQTGSNYKPAQLSVTPNQIYLKGIVGKGATSPEQVKITFDAGSYPPELKPYIEITESSDTIEIQYDNEDWRTADHVLINLPVPQSLKVRAKDKGIAGKINYSMNLSVTYK